jgi:nicotinic acid mononucleotide adenylyltransferase
MADGTRLDKLPKSKHWAIMSGAYNPPHEGHFGVAAQVFEQHSKRVIFETTAEPPHKDALTVQQLLQRAKLLQGHDRFFTRTQPYYLDKARAFPNTTFVMGADACLRMFDPKWGLNARKMMEEFDKLGTDFIIASRTMNGEFQCVDDVTELLADHLHIGEFEDMFLDLDGEWNFSSTEIRDKLLQSKRDAR